MKLWKKVLAAVTAGVLCVGSAGLSGVQQIALAAYAETTSVLAAEDSADSDTLELGIESKSITIEELEDENYEVTLDITSSREFNGLGVGVRLSEGMEFVENGLKSSLDRAGELAIANNDFAFMPVFYTPVPIETIPAGKFATVTVKIPKEAKVGDVYSLQVVGEYNDGTPVRWKDSVSGECGYPVGSSGAIIIREVTDSDFILGIDSKELTVEELKAANYSVSLDITSNQEFNSVMVGVNMNNGLTYEKFRPTISRASGLAVSLETYAYMSFAYAPVPLETVKAGTFAEVTVKVPESLSSGIAHILLNEQIFYGPKLTVLGNVSVDKGYVVQNGLTGKTGHVFGSSGYITILESPNPPETYGYLYYIVTDNDEVEIVGCDADAVYTFMEIPEEIDGKPVTSIADHAFDNCTELTHVTILANVDASTSSSWFGNCPNLQSVTTYDDIDLKRPATSADYEDDIENRNVLIATSVTTLNVVSRTGKVRASAYQNCTHLQAVVLEDVTLIEDDAFSNCTNLEEITIPKSVTGIRNTAFDHDTKLSIHGFKNSYAQKYAEMFGFPFIALDEPSLLMPGDLDDSGSVDSTGIYYALYYVANIAVGNDGGLTAEQITAADVDGSGTVDSTDIYYILYYVALHGAGINKIWEEILSK